MPYTSDLYVTHAYIMYIVTGPVARDQNPTAMPSIQRCVSGAANVCGA